jgi:FkbM family methyltransferase
VVACEPFPESAERCRKNCALIENQNSKFELRNVAVWRSDVAVESLDLHPHIAADLPACFSVTLSNCTRKSWQVPAVSLDSILIELGAVHLLKLDCEGSEFPILYTSQELRRCEHIIGEYHADALPSLAGPVPESGWPDWSLAGLIEFLKSQGFETYRVEENSRVHGGWAISMSHRSPVPGTPAAIAANTSPCMCGPSTSVGSRSQDTASMPRASMASRTRPEYSQAISQVMCLSSSCKSCCPHSGRGTPAFPSSAT